MQKHATPIIERKSPSDSVAKELILRGTIFGLLAAIGYTAANVFLRSSIAVDPLWVSCVKAIPTVVLFAPWLLLRVVRSERLLPSPKALAILVVVAIIGQVGGNVVFQWALGVIGLALCVPLTLAAMIITGAWLGWATLKEPISGRTMLSIVLLIAAAAVLCLGAPAAQASLQKVAGHDSWQVLLGVSAACLAGVSYALLGVAIRNASHHGCPAVSTVMIVGIAGVVILLPLCLMHVGIDTMLATNNEAMLRMIAAGVGNALAFIALTKSLELIGVVYVNALNATQAAMAAVAGVMIFGEPLSAALWLGVLLTAGGLLLMKRRKPRDPPPQGR